ncbi:MAG: HigA family addiction module antidote protein [Magnetococcales bacterium]|nr:HigA family addiction module antidote protein [Magnetococcales bacterium]
MSNSQQNQYIPDYLVAPGEVLDEYLQAYPMTQAQLAMRTGLAKKTINEIIKGKSPITTDTAQKLERVLERPAHFWNNLERQYQEDKSRLAEQERLETELDWLQWVPVAKMIKLGWIEKFKDKKDQLGAVLNFFGVASREQWVDVWEWTNSQSAYRQTKRFETRAEAVSAWLRRGEIEARKMPCAPFDKEQFQQALEKIRSLTTQTPDVFQPKLIELCALAGVAVVFVPELPKTGISGATRWLGDKAVIQLSLRYKKNDYLWFTFFHEAGHIIKHGRKEIFIEGNGLDGDKEEEADKFARDWLIPPANLRAFQRKWDGRSLDPVVDFAREIGIAPGIVVGRLQHDKLLPVTHGHKLKITLRWKNAEV